MGARDRRVAYPYCDRDAKESRLAMSGSLCASSKKGIPVFPSPLSDQDRDRLLALTELVVEQFTASDWQVLAAKTGTTDIVDGHARLLRSLSWGDEDYEGNAHTVMLQIVERDHANLQKIDEIVTRKYGEPEGFGENVSTAPSKSRVITFKPSVFEVPDGRLDPRLIAVMTPFAAEFEEVFQAISGAAIVSGFHSLRAKDIWQHSTVIQDVFSLIFRAHIVVCDFTGKNPNVFYEAGIAHTLGKHVVPITQSQADIPFDLQHHRYLQYLNNGEGRAALGSALEARFVSLR